MKLVMCAVFDSVVGAYMQPFWAKSSGEAVRGFSDACNDSKMPFGAHPTDYALFAFGTFDDSNGVCDMNREPVRLITALDCMSKA